MRWWLAAAFAVIGATDVQAQQYLERVESPVYETTGDVAALAGRAATCAAQILKPGMSTAPTVLATDLEGGVVVANNYFEFVGNLYVLKARSKVRFEARPGRFRITHTDIEVFNSNWRRVQTPKEGKRDAMREQLQALSDELAACVRANPTAEW